MSGKRAKQRRREAASQEEKHERFTRFVRGELKDIPTAEEMARIHGITLEEAEYQIERIRQDEIWINNLYQVNISRPSEAIIHLSIKRRDKKPVHDWRHLQWIKSMLVGPENEAIELYPAESRVVDYANQYHLWCFADPNYRVPLGFSGGRAVDYRSTGGSKQRSEMKIG